MAKLPAKKKPKNMIEGKTGEAAKVQKPIRIPTVKKDAPSKPAPQIVTKPSPSIAKAGSRTVIPKGMTQGKLDPKRVVKESRTKDDKATTASTKTSTTSKKKLSGFGTAFAAARKSGKKEFTYRGKRYNTKVK